VAAPVFGPDKDVVAAVGVSGPTARLEDRLDELGQLLKEHTEELSGLLRRGRHAVDETGRQERDTA
jgi:IclR family acetate operon transcriptional repressor